jgi:hypothetical protein
MEHACVFCENVLPEISEEEFFSSVARNLLREANGVLFTSDAYEEEIHRDSTENWECDLCWWKGWWDI